MVVAIVAAMDDGVVEALPCTVSIAMVLSQKFVSLRESDDLSGVCDQVLGVGLSVHVQSWLFLMISS